jgi:hypothetical protein
MFVEEQESIVVDILCSLIILPLEAKPYSGISKYINMFLTEWFKIEKWFSTKDEKIYILKNIVSFISNEMSTFKDDDYVTTFKMDINKLIDSYGYKILLQDICFKDLYDSIIGLSICFEGVMFKLSQRCMARKDREWTLMKDIKSSFDLYKIVEPYLSHEEPIQLNDYFIVFDCVNETTFSFMVDDESTIRKYNLTKGYDEKIKYLLTLTDTLESEGQD